jgi:hypothetical protein
MTGVINACLKHFKFLDHEGAVKRRTEPEEYFSQVCLFKTLSNFQVLIFFNFQPFMCSHFTRLAFIFNSIKAII